MSGLETAAAVIGIVDVTFKGVSALYEFLDKMSRARDDVAKMRAETGALFNVLMVLNDLDLRGAGEDDRNRLKRICLADDVDNCNAACEALAAKLRKWSEKGEDHFLTRLQVAFHEKEIQRHTTRIESTKGTVQLAISTATLSILADRLPLLDKSGQENEAIRMHTETIARVREEAEAVREASGQELQKYRQEIDPDDATATQKEALQNLQLAFESAQKYWASCETTVRELRTSKQLTVSIKDVISDKRAKVWVGVPSGVVQLVESLSVGTVNSNEDAEVHLGVF